MNSKLEYWLLFFLFVLIIFGTWIQFSASSIYAYNKFNDMYYFSHKQVIWHFTGIFLMFLTIFFPLKFIKKNIVFLMYFTIFLLILVYVPGISRSVYDEVGQMDFKRWISILGITLQPSEFAKISFLLYIAYLVEKYDLEQINKIYKEILPLLIILILLFFQPQYGTMLLLILVAIALLIISGFPIIRFFLLFVSFVPIIILLGLLQPYRFERIRIWLNPEEYKFDKGYQIYMSFKAFREGGLWGTDIHKGIAHRYLTYGYTDFIFSLLAENLGLMGIIFLLFLFLSILILGFMLVKEIDDPFYYVLASGILILFLFQVLINIFVTTGLIPVTGIGLPFVSYGGSSLISYYILFGIFFNILRINQK